MIKKILVYFFSIIALLPGLVLAEGNLGNATDNLLTTGRGAVGDQTVDENLATTIGKFINIALSLLGLIFLVLMVYAGFLWMTARGEEAPVEKARKIIINSIIGLVIVICAYAITALVTSSFSS